MNDLIQEQESNALTLHQRSALPANVNAGAVSIEVERAVAEARGQMQLAKMFPRDENDVYSQFMKSCKMPQFAAVAFYTMPQGGQKVTGPSIRFAEEIARLYCNFEYGHRELGRIEAGAGAKEFGRSEVEIYAWDKQTNNRQIRQITVMHVLDTRDGPRKLRDQRDIDNKIANIASKQMRGRILAMMPKWLVEAGIEECRKTLDGNNKEPIEVRVRKMTQAFATYGVTSEHLSEYLGHGLDKVLSDELVTLMGVFNAIKDGTPPSEYFGVKDGEDPADKNAAADIAAAAKAGANKQAEKPAAQRKPAAAKPAAKPAESQKEEPKATEPEPQQEQQELVEEPEAQVEQIHFPDDAQDNAGDDGQGGNEPEGDDVF